MRDLIDRQAAVDAVKKNTFRLTFAEEQNCEGHVAWSAEAVYSDVMEGALLELPSAQPEPKWIPVSERLPETEEFVLASLTGKYRNTTFEHACEIADYAGGGWCVYAYPHMSAEKCEELIEAWMPLPKPFEGGVK